MKRPKLEAFVKKEEPPTDDDDVDLEDDDDWKPQISAPASNSLPVPKKSGKEKVLAPSKKVSIFFINQFYPMTSQFVTIYLLTLVA